MIRFAIELGYGQMATAATAAIALFGAIIGGFWKALTYFHEKEISAKNEHLRMKEGRIAELEQQLRTPSEHEATIRILQTAAATEKTRLNEELERAKLNSDAAVKAVIEQKLKREDELSADLAEAQREAAEARQLRAEADEKLAKIRTLVPVQASPFMSLLSLVNEGVSSEVGKRDAIQRRLRSLIEKDISSAKQL